MIFELSPTLLEFPHPSLANSDGLLAIGGDLSAERLKLAYASGIFPWFNEGEPILWYSPEQRCVLFPDDIHISHSMRSIIRSQTFTLTTDQAFDEVIQKCAQQPRPGQEGTWIGTEMIRAYRRLHQLGYAHSLEVWQENQLVGGLYGVVHQNIFCGESMFSLVANASKLALIHLCQSGKYFLIDCQVPNHHLLQMGARLISRKEFLLHLQKSNMEPK